MSTNFCQTELKLSRPTPATSTSSCRRTHHNQEQVVDAQDVVHDLKSLTVLPYVDREVHRGDVKTERGFADAVAHEAELEMKIAWRCGAAL